MKNITEHIQQYTKIGIALSAEKNLDTLLEMIVDEARALSHADAGTLYVFDREKKCLRFEILHNDTLNVRFNSTTKHKIKLPDVPLYLDNVPNYTNVSSYVALTGNSVNIPDVYQTEEFNLSGTRKYDAKTGYRSISMLVLPLKNYDNAIIGVLQLLNAKDPDTGQITPFSVEYEELIASLASQAAVALTNTHLIQDLKDLFYSFIKTIATAIDEKSPYTGDHIRHVVDLTMMIAHEINSSEQEPFKHIRFNEDQLEELRIAAWMHDVGKVTSPEYVVDKATKLQTIFDRIALIETRFELIKCSLENCFLKHKIEVLHNGDNVEAAFAALDQQLAQEIQIIEDDLSFLKRCNTINITSDNDRLRLEHIAHKTYSVKNASEKPYLTQDELQNLSIQRGTLLPQERNVIENHVKMTLKITQQLPFPEKLAMVPEFAGAHHEKPDGSGYPRQLSGNALPLQSRILALADIFEALTASNRPYKSAMQLSQVLEILETMGKQNRLDPDILNLFIHQKLHLKYAQQELSPKDEKHRDIAPHTNVNR